MSERIGGESPILRWAGKLGAFFGLSLFWLLCCLPVVTFFPACVALYDSVVHCVHGDEPGAFGRFFATLKDELLRGILVSVLWLVLIAVFVLGFQIVNNAGKENSVFAIFNHFKVRLYIFHCFNS